MNVEGYKRLSLLLSQGNREAAKGECDLAFKDLAEYTEDILAIVLPPRKIEDPAFHNRLRKLADLYPGRCYLAGTMLFRGNDAARLARLDALAAQTGVRLVATNDVHYHVPERRAAAINAVASEVMNWSLAKYDSGNPAALRRLIAAGAELRAFPREMMAACYDIALDQYEELAAKNPKFKKIYDSWKPFRDEQYLWSRVAENTFDNFVYAQQAAKKR
jgi:DNA polymerase III alpha subunit